MDVSELFIDSKNLPPRLTEEETKFLLNQAKSGSQEAREKIMLHNIRLVLAIVTRVFANVVYDKKDLVSIGIIGLLKAVDTYDISKEIMFSTYAYRCISNEIISFLKKINRDNNVDSLDEIINHGKDDTPTDWEYYISDKEPLIEEIIIEKEKAEDYKIIREVVNLFPDREREIIMLYFGFYNDRTYSQQEIADKLGISRAYISYLITETIKKIGEILQSRGVIELHSKKSTPKRTKKKANE